MIKIGINGFGRIGRICFRIMAEQPQKFEVVAINDLIDANYMAYMLKYDSVFRRFNGSVEAKDGHLFVNGKKIRVTAEKDPVQIKWGEVGVDVVIESTGKFLTTEDAMKHIAGGAKKVILSAPAKDDTPMFVYGVNHKELKKELQVISNASCTTNCFAPLVKVLHENFGVAEGLMTTVHAVTAEQNIVDVVKEKDHRRGRSGLTNIVPTTTGAAKAAGKVFAPIKGRVNGMALRVPTIDGSCVDFTFRTEKETNYEEIKVALKKAAENEFKGIIEYNEDDIVSGDVIANPCTCMFDAKAGMEMSKTFFKVIAWYDNEFGYSVQLVRMIDHWMSL